MFKLKIKPAETLHTKYGTAKIHKNGYYLITSGKEGNNRKLLHRLVWEDFYGPIPEGCVIHHKDENKLNNCILNLQLLSESEHKSLHKKCEKNPNYGKKISEETKRKMSKSKNTTGFLNVCKRKNPKCKQGFIWCYQYFEDRKRKSITSVDICKLKDKVLARGLSWIVFDEEKPNKNLKEIRRF